MIKLFLTIICDEKDQMRIFVKKRTIEFYKLFRLLKKTCHSIQESFMGIRFKLWLASSSV